MGVHVAQVNIATIRAPVGDPLVAEFVDNLDRINAIADAAPGFVWRLQTAEGNATSIHAFPDPMLLVNMSVWESVEALQEFAYRTEHREYVKRRAEWFVDGSTRLALWWIPKGTVPDVDEAKRRLAFLADPRPISVRVPVRQDTTAALVARTTFADESTVALVHRLNDELSAMYPEDGANHFTLDPESVIPPAGVMVRATLDGHPIACGAIRLLDERTGELKRMFVDPECAWAEARRRDPRRTRVRGMRRSASRSSASRPVAARRPRSRSTRRPATPRPRSGAST